MEVGKMRFMPACLNMGYAGIGSALFLYLYTARIAVNILLQAPQDEITRGIPIGRGPSV